MKIKRHDDTYINVFDIDCNSENVIYGFAGFGYTIHCPLLYYIGNLALQYNIDYFGIDFGYSYNDNFNTLLDDEKDSYFDNDIKLIDNFINCKKYKNRFFIGKSLGTTIINRLMENKAVTNKDHLVYLTPGNEWNRIIDNIEKLESNILIIGSKADPSFNKYSYTQLLSNKFIKIIEYEKENHVLETGNLNHDLQVLTEVLNQIECFIREYV